MKRDWARVSRLLALSLALGASGVSPAQVAAPAAIEPASPQAQAPRQLDVLRGNWVRPDGGYTIAIRSIGTDGKIEASYFNPNQLPFAKAQAIQDGATLRVSFELRAGGYDGSTYELVYDPSTDRLSGVYYQAVARQKFEVSFARK